MKIQLRIILLVIGLNSSLLSSGVYLENYPLKVKQPNGKELSIFLTGDEFYNWMHDKNYYTIVQDEYTGYYCYALCVNDDLIASKYIVGEVAPEKAGLSPKINISHEALQSKMNKIFENMPEEETEIPEKINTKSAAIMQNLNNIVVYIRFADQTEFPSDQAIYSALFNSNTTGESSLRNYFYEATYNQLDISSTFYPTNNGTTIISYQDNHIRDYYRWYSASNDSGYVNFDTAKARERELFRNAIEFINSQIPSTLNVDYNNDGFVDNICFIERGETSGNIIFPHMFSLPYPDKEINNKRVRDYNVQVENDIRNSEGGTLCHEMYHSLGAKDLYHAITRDEMRPVGRWDIMGATNDPPQHMGAYMKFKHGGWIANIPEITSTGTYTLNPITTSTNNCYKIAINSTTYGQLGYEYFVLEYRKKGGTFEGEVDGSGLLVYRINELSQVVGNSHGEGPGGLIKDEVFIFRKDGAPNIKGDITNAHLSSNVNRNEFHNNSNPYCFNSDGILGNVYITNISEAGSTISFDIRFCDGDDVVYSNNNNLPSLSNASNSISTSGTVTVQSNDNVTFEAGNEIILNAGFEVQTGGVFEAKIGECGNP